MARSVAAQGKRVPVRENRPTSWISPSVLDWSASLDTKEFYDINEEEAIRRPFQLLQHAEGLLGAECSAEQRADCVSNLHRALKLRLRDIELVYKFKSLRAALKPRGLLELFALLGIIKPLMLEELVEIRNVVEHEDGRPPARMKCSQLVEFVWYFLRSTDRLLRRYSGRLTFHFKDHSLASDPYWIEIDFELDSGWVPRVSAWIPETAGATGSQPAWIECLAEEVARRDEAIRDFKNFLGLEGKELDPRALGKFPMGLEPEDHWLRGVIRGPGEVVLRLIRRVFELQR